MIQSLALFSLFAVVACGTRTEWYRVDEGTEPPQHYDCPTDYWARTGDEEHTPEVIILEVLVDRHGSVRDVRVLKLIPFITPDQLLNYLRSCKWTPGRREGKPVDVIFNMILDRRELGRSEEHAG